MNIRKAPQIPLALFGLTLVLPLLLWDYFSAPVQMRRCIVRQAIVSGLADALSIDGFFAKDGRAIAVGESFCDGEVPLHLSGKTSLPDGALVRVFQKETQGGFYLHQPALKIENGAWHIDEILTGGDIRELRFALVNAATDTELGKRAAQGQWGPYPLPSDARTVASIPLTPTSSCKRMEGRICVR